MKRTSMLFALLLALVLVILPAPRAMAAEAVSYDGENVIVTANEEAETLLAQDPNLPQLATPTDLTWGKWFNGAEFLDRPGHMTFQLHEPFQGELQIVVYHADGTRFTAMSYSFGREYVPE